MKLIITRPAADAEVLAQKLRSRGHGVLVAPVLSIEPKPGVMIPERPFQALCITSANALMAENLNALSRTRPVYCVGPQSCRAARKKGFTDVRERGGNVEGLAEAIRRELQPANGPLLYLSGAETSGDLEGRLSQSGFQVDRIVVYDAVPKPITLSESEIESADGVLLYSPRSARLWMKAVAARPQMNTSRILHFCLSQNVAAILPANWRKCIAVQPTEDHMLSMLDRHREAE